MRARKLHGKALVKLAFWHSQILKFLDNLSLLRPTSERWGSCASNAFGVVLCNRTVWYNKTVFLHSIRTCCRCVNCVVARLVLFESRWPQRRTQSNKKMIQVPTILIDRCPQFGRLQKKARDIRHNYLGSRAQIFYTCAVVKYCV